jgi:hypothetical protein
MLQPLLAAVADVHCPVQRSLVLQRKQAAHLIRGPSRIDHLPDVEFLDRNIRAKPCMMNLAARFKGERPDYKKVGRMERTPMVRPKGTAPF